MNFGISVLRVDNRSSSSRVVVYKRAVRDLHVSIMARIDDRNTCSIPLSLSVFQEDIQGLRLIKHLRWLNQEKLPHVTKHCCVRNRE